MTKPLALIVEDDPQFSRIFTLTLSESFETEAIIDGAKALVRLADIVLPKPVSIAQFRDFAERLK